MDADVALRALEERTAVVIRLLVVCSVGVALVLEPGLARGRAALLGALVLVTLAYALVLGVGEWWGRRLVPPRVATSVDAALALLACGLTGGADSVMVAILPLVVIAGAVRGGVVVGRLGALGVGAGFTVAALAGSDPQVSVSDRWMAGVWWTGYLVAAAVLVGVLLRMLERQYEAAAESRARARAEHEAFLEERDLRSRLLAAQQARLDGVRVVLHEFRTPVASLTALSADLAADRLSGPARETATRLLAEHAVHLRDMLDGLADVAVQEGSPLGRVRERTVRLAELADAVLDAAGVAPERRVADVEPPEAAVRCDPQRLRRVLTNLVENAARHSGDAPVELDLRHSDGQLVVEVRDRGPGLPPGQEGVVTAKGVALGERRGTAGLGLWIVEALVAAMDGELRFLPRDDGGLVAHLELPLPSA
ncbi:signal transduction histidine kinase [Pseudonocardia hierapolitana]|uniref:Sensor-like histidine kinase SenX3 n=1 Tax=Pseudonocardia hierapolitana TaxID=1128676 RepID=A0A561STX3_9PSEU|nr:HAMP domain-containing sensor histidine kinase [Pseudonocardia hierapolitana]TWF78276.1 signal transduction histidine kinase [Pseudonocardia hierapolitana]